MNKFSFLLLSSIFLFSCAGPEISPKNNPREYQVSSYLWYQTSGEFRALCYQAYNLATQRLSELLKTKTLKPKAVVFDIDETVLDNSVGGALEVKEGVKWSKEGFDKWVKLKSASFVPGAYEFIEFALKNNVEVIFISNRYTWHIDDTFENFKKLGLKVNKDNFLFLESDWSKENRRRLVESKYEVLLLFGDNLHDFDDAWDGKNSIERRNIVDTLSAEFGKKFIILPNPLYGDWENSLPKTKVWTDNLRTTLP